MRAEKTRYEVPGWGVGELWTGGDLVVSHEIEFTAAGRARENGATAGSLAAATGAGDSGKRLPPGAFVPPTKTVPLSSSRVGDGLVAGPQLSGKAHDGAELDADSRARVDPDELVGRFTAFLAGTDVPLADVPLDLTWTTPFQLAVASVLRSIPRGEVVTYGELAALAGYPGAQRAAGTFCARNRFMLLVPCHRVVGAAGIGGYGSAGVDVKRRLLALEGVAV